LRSSIAAVPGIKDVDVCVEEKFLRFKFDARKTVVQTLMKSFLGDNRFPSRLALQLENPAADLETIEKARTAVAAVPGVRAMSLPDREGVVLITFHLDKSTLLPDLLEAAKGAGLPLRDAPAKKPSRPKDKD
jgi:hypothetical protein